MGMKKNTFGAEKISKAAVRFLDQAYTPISTEGLGECGWAQIACVRLDCMRTEPCKAAAS